MESKSADIITYRAMKFSLQPAARMAIMCRLPPPTMRFSVSPSEEAGAQNPIISVGKVRPKADPRARANYQEPQQLAGMPDGRNFAGLTGGKTSVGICK